ncbi:MAG: methyltransferase domain-containing protein [Acidimicrobiia bacterium]|nr:methyltransferase domain-containing protein [Acidimicrobiia bacterium]
MSDCCDPGGYRRFFNTKEAERRAKRHRRKGLDATAEPMLEAVSDRVPGAVVLEGGAGTGEAHVAMLRRGAAQAIAVDISDAYERVAESIAAEEAVADRIERRTGDLATMPDLPEADIVFLNRVVCCYPDMPGLVDAAGRLSTGLVAMSYPRDRWFVRLGFRMLNAFLRLRRVPFRVYVHDPAAIAGRMRPAGFDVRSTGRTIGWHWGVWQRA